MDGHAPSHIVSNPTAGGLVFIGSWGDGFVHAFDKDTGKILWEKELDANPEGIPAVFETGGRQYVAFLATGRQGPVAGGGENITFKVGKPEAQGYYVFALPRAK